jgi:hypothetical protein
MKGHKREKMENPFGTENFEFRPHRQGFQASATFENEFGVSVIPELDQKHYEVAILRKGKLCYDSGLTSDVFRFQTVSDVHNIVRQVQSLERGFKALSEVF